MANFVLVHGAYQGAWVYARIARLLRAAGHEVYTPTLTGLGERAHLVHCGINLDTHIQDIINVFHYENITEAILCGHSYGGMVITGVANAIGERIRSLCYIDAYAPQAGQSLFSITGANIAHAFLDQANEHGGMLPPIPAALFNLNASDAPWVDAMSVPQPLATFVQGVRAGVESVPVAQRTYIFATANGGDWLASTYARVKDDPQWKVQVLACGHAIMLDRPEELTAMLLAETAVSSLGPQANIAHLE